MLMHRAEGLPLRYEFLSETDLPGSSTVTVKQIDENVGDLAVTFLAKDLRGRASYAVASALLYLASAAAIGFGFSVVRRRDGARIAFEALLIFVFLGYIVASTPAAFDLMRPLVVEAILKAAKNLAPPMNYFASGDADRSLFNQIVGGLFHRVEQFGDPAVTGLVRLNSIIGLIAVGMLLAALASISVRREDAPTHEELLLRLTIMRIVLALGAAVLVVSVVNSKVLIEWPASLLSNSQHKAIAPIGEAMNLMLGASCTMALIAAMGPALAAFVLDRSRAFPAAPADNRQAGTTALDRAPANAAPAQRFPDDLAFARWPSISAAVAVISPLLASPLLDLVKSIVKISQS
ncbi:MAG: hypothetical protein ACR2KT_07760 [Methylocella sp.]|nr:MAG: hypothetical protein DLM68_06885 [Hyphomicrobiales bacterium]